VREIVPEERVQPQSRPASPAPKRPPSAAERIDRLEHALGELQDQVRRLRNEVSGLQTVT
jgi:hypothetical protein